MRESINYRVIACVCYSFLLSCVIIGLSAHASYTKVKEFLYEDAAGNLYFKVYNPASIRDKTAAKHIYLKTVYLNDKPIAVRDLVDVATLRRKEFYIYSDNSNWVSLFADRDYIYRHSALSAYSRTSVMAPNQSLKTVHMTARKRSKRKLKLSRLKPGVYKNARGEYFLRSKNAQRLGDPFEPEYSYHKQMHTGLGFIALKKIIDLETIRPLRKDGMYYADKARVYLHAPGRLRPGQRRFTVIETRSAKVIGSRSVYLVTDGGVYYFTRLVDGADAKTVKAVSIKLKKHNGTYELIKDKSAYFWQGEKLTEDLLCRTGLSNAERTEVIHEILRNKAWKPGDCKKNPTY